MKKIEKSFGKGFTEKTSWKKRFALLEIAIVLCSVFLMASSAVATEQTTQKVGACTITADSEEYIRGPLDVFGNANDDEIIDMRDTTYIKLVIFDKKPKTKLSDANYDGKVSMLDVGQTKLIILGKEKKLTFIDLLGEAVTVTKPIKRLANLGTAGILMTRALGARNILLPIVGYDRSNQPNFYPVISKWPAVGYEPDTCDLEYVLSLEPDAVQTNIEARWTIPNGPEDKRMFKEKLPGIPIICLNMREPDVLPENIRTYGYILDRENEAEEFIDWFAVYFNTIKTRTEGLSADERPRVYFERQKPYECAASGSRLGVAINLAGGKNIVDEIIGPGDPGYGSISNKVDPEWVVVQNPEFIFKRTIIPRDYETDDPSAKTAARQEIMNRPELAKVDAVKNKHVYVVGDMLLSKPGSNIIGTAYMAKWLHPKLFEDIDPQAMHQEFVDRFCYIDFNVYEHGVFVYPTPEWEQ